MARLGAFPSPFELLMSDDNPTPSEITAAISLLGDDDPSVVRACRAQLVTWGELARVAVDEASESPSAKLRVSARSVARSLDLRSWTHQVHLLGERVSRSGSDEVLTEGLELFLRIDRPGAACVEGVRSRLEELTIGAKQAMCGRATGTRARQLAAYLGGGEQGFRGCASSYYRPENLFMDRVLERRRGLPIALAVLYLLVGRAAGLEMTAVQLPDSYFLTRVHGRRALLLDPFHGGRAVTKADCRRYLRSVGTTNPASSWLRDVDDVDVLLGMMSTLGRVHEHREDREFHEALLQAQLSLACS